MAGVEKQINALAINKYSQRSKGIATKVQEWG
jgi:hypothetical protein